MYLQEERVKYQEKSTLLRMRFTKRRKGAISSNLLTGTIVGGFVGVVVFALIWTSTLNSPGTQGTQLSFNEIALFGGSPSTHSLNSTCGGGAQLEVSIQNPTNENITVQNVVIYGSGVKNATAYRDAFQIPVSRFRNRARDCFGRRLFLGGLRQRSDPIYRRLCL